MDKRYYSARHRRIRQGYVNRNNIKSESIEKSEKGSSTFVLRLNICLGLAIITIGGYQIKKDIGETLKRHLMLNTSIESIKETAESIKNAAGEKIEVSLFGGEEFTPDEEAIEYINKMEENSYYNIQKNAESPNEAFIKPVDTGVITDVFGERVNPITGQNEMHKGLDIGVSENTEAKAVKSGKVIDEGYSDSYGNWIKYETYDGYDILYAHLSEVKAKKGQEIKQGEVIAYTGNTGSSTGPHLHYEVMEDGEYLNPYEFY